MQSSDMRLAPQLGQIPRLLQLKTSFVFSRLTLGCE
jgi:hypothetical protein